MSTPMHDSRSTVMVTDDLRGARCRPVHAKTRLELQQMDEARSSSASMVTSLGNDRLLTGRRLRGAQPNFLLRPLMRCVP